MSETDGFIQEVTEAVRRDRLFKLFRKWGWIPVLLVVLLVAGTAYNEYSKSRDAAAAQMRGDAILAALDAEDAATRLKALQAIQLEGQAEAVVKLLESAQAVDAGDLTAAVAALDAMISDTGYPQLYRDMALFKKVVLTSNDTAPADRVATLQPLLIAGGPFRTLAEEQIALAEIEMGQRDAALTRLRALNEDTEATAGLRRRVSQLIVVLGGDAEPA